jgi:hypothetical protein
MATRSRHLYAQGHGAARDHIYRDHYDVHMERSLA